MKYTAIVLDLDGTLLNSEKRISDRNFNSVIACHKRGMQIIFATARPPRTVNSFLPKELLDIGSFVYYNGALISSYNIGINIHEPIDSVISAEVFDHCLNCNPDIEIGIEVQDEWFSLKEIDHSIVTKVSENPIIKTLEEIKGLDATKILITGKINVEELREKFESHLNIVVTDNGQLIQIMSKRASKEIGVTKLLDGFGLHPEGVIVFGDDHNDIGLFNTCGWSVAMGNAIKELKDISSIITENNDNDGVAIELERIMKIYAAYSRRW
ncbi:Cof-type HAD-IIB family hydrolase [Paenibacillus alkalitolerans]|uniref:Cof-type HAD-IIB family hydrolase n=1 Tax=Paenibacillus alkalitolerans TaxID=2799335 RepID=UPI0018F34968|nr:Cof-type HAD-IIB family hydrolase [Paenibacillus alkalitolerans]